MPQVEVSLPEEDIFSYDVDLHSVGVSAHHHGGGRHEIDAAVSAVDHSVPPELEPGHEDVRRRFCWDSVSDPHQVPLLQQTLNLTGSTQGRPHPKKPLTVTCPRIQPTPAQGTVVQGTTHDSQVADDTAYDWQPISTDVELGPLSYTHETRAPGRPSAMLVKDGSTLQAVANSPGWSDTLAHPLGAGSVAEENGGTRHDLETAESDVSDMVDVEIDSWAELDEEIMPPPGIDAFGHFAGSSIGHGACPELGNVKDSGKSDFSAILQVPLYLSWVLQMKSENWVMDGARAGICSPSAFCWNAVLYFVAPN